MDVVMQKASKYSSKRKGKATVHRSPSVYDQASLPEWLQSDSDDDQDFYGFPLSMVQNGEPSDQTIQYTLSDSWYEHFGDSDSGEEEFEGFALSDLLV